MNTPKEAETRIRQASLSLDRLFIPIDELRHRAGLDYAEFDQALLRLARQEKIQLLHGDQRERCYADLLYVPGSVPDIPYVLIQWLEVMP
ncbi:hypothetical protein DENIS_3937 [Desulfonema ishimotonii]|uniref:Uncharacterized protein n=1 Tax=Desulfonema ishimotonii TaxID=45657 RepID=A0A401G155_9BACT|nr:hypothetical protein [Desulfonema ishimotonii]GBC62952.1 hypothetical protein DENIS_3937 [Desulfonema ishimotonii]